MIRDFESWTAPLVEVSKLAELRGCHVAIEAADYIRTHLLHHPNRREPLVNALGGVHNAFKTYIKQDLDNFANCGIEPLFVFSGLDLAKQEDPFKQRQEGAATNASAWALYDNQEADKSVLLFGKSTYFTSEEFYLALQSELTEHKTKFLVAPYSAWAQLAYLARHNAVQAISGSSEILLFECERVITRWDFESGEYSWIQRGSCLASMKKHVNNADITDDMFVDACLLAGSHFLPTLPNLDSPQRNKALKPIGAIEMIMNGGRSGISVVLNNQDDPRFRAMQYTDKYRKARLAVKHHPVLTTEGKIVPTSAVQLPNDAHEFIGQRLPDEICHYLSRGLINARIINWRATSEIIEATPMDGGESQDYQNLVSSKLTPLRTTAINLLSSSLHNWYQHKDLTLRCWFLEPTTKRPYTSTISMKGLPDTKRVVETWNVREAAIKDVISQYRPAGSMGAAILALQNPDFVSKSSSNKDVNNPLSTTDEIVYNSIWRFLALRDYIDVNHNLTAWGKTLATVITALNGRLELEEAAVIAIELLRLNILNSDMMFPSYGGAPMRGEERDRNFNMLVSRVAGIGNLQHKAIGFTGPLSQHLLGYNSIINAVRSTVRDLVEVSATQTFMTGSAKRDIDNLPNIATKLPFLLPNSCVLSIAVKSYLDELCTYTEPTSPEVKAQVKEIAKTKFFPHALDLAHDLDMAFDLWTAVYEGVKTSGNLLAEKEKSTWSEAYEWLSARR